MAQEREKRFQGWWLFLSLLYGVLFTVPFIEIFNTAQTVFGLPLLLAYLFGGWLLFILVIFLFVKKLGPLDKKEPER